MAVHAVYIARVAEDVGRSSEVGPDLALPQYVSC
jgi:hypothetical protein